MPPAVFSLPGRKTASGSTTTRASPSRRRSSSMAYTRPRHSVFVGFPAKGRQKRLTSLVMSSLRQRSSQASDSSSVKTAAWPTVTGRPASSPPISMRARSTDIRVVFPDFHWLVRRVILPGPT